LIVNIDKEINSFLLSLADHTNKEEINKIIEKYSISITETLKNGHITTNVCLVAASNLKLNPIELASKLVKKLNLLNLFETVETAGPGFINITLRREDFVSIINSINDNEEKYGESNIGNGKKIQIEFVSANPTGPLHVGHGRGAAYGDAIGRILKATGYDVQKEYYINDAGRQIDILTASVILKSISKEIGDYFPENAYKGEYINEISKKFEEKAKVTYQNLDSVLNVQKSFLDSKVDDEKEIDAVILSLKNLNIDFWDSVKKISVNEIVYSIKNDLKKFNVSFNNWFRESSLGNINENSSIISSSINKLKKDGHAYEKDNAIWLNTESSGDDKHRVLVRDDGRPTYFASDVAYHKDKIDRGFDTLINVWGADHHGYIKRIEASIEALGSKKEKMIVKLVQFANLYKNGKKVKMSTRSGDFFTLGNLIDEIGSDASRFYYLSKQADQHLDFDLDLAQSDNKENIFYYIQYAHARICSLLDKYNKNAGTKNLNLSSIEKNSYNQCDELIHEISKYPDVITKASNTLQPHLIIFYLRDLSQLFHSYYNDNHVLSESNDNIEAIISCLSSVGIVISNGLNLLGITPIKKM
tara:strand:+ start:1653 stop:3416 length:1764 start_codon:yes stop_codon:yes gene_type:complete